jgi:hypothetical protein
VTVANGVRPPTAPQDVRATGRDGQATVTWRAPADQGGSPIVSYRVTASPGGVGVTVGASARTATIPGLDTTSWYTFSVTATNAQTSGPAGTSGDVWIADGDVPAVTAHSPATNARSVAVGSVVTATFSEAVTGVDDWSFVLSGPSSQIVPATVRYDSATRTATLDPTVNLAARSRYVVELGGGIWDSSGNWLPDTTWSFSTGPAPAVTTVAPAVNGTGVSVGANLTTQFSVPVTGVSGTTVQLRTSAGKVVPAAVSYNSTTRTVTLNPTANLAADNRYTVTLTGGSAGIRDWVDNPLATTSWSFLTGPAPTVTAMSPGPGATGVSVAANVAARFSEAVRGLSASSFQLRTSTGKVLPAALSYNSTTRTVTLNPTANLAGRTRYTVVLVGGATAVRDGAGNALRTVSWVFTTR